MFKRKRFDYDLMVIGSGAGGSVGAHYARSLGKKVALFEKGEIGGECPNFACVPTKALLHSADMYETIQHAHSVGVHAKAFIDYEQIHKRKDLVVSRTGASHGASAFKDDGIHVVQQKATYIYSDN